MNFPCCFLSLHLNKICLHDIELLIVLNWACCSPYHCFCLIKHQLTPPPNRSSAYLKLFIKNTRHDKYRVAWIKYCVFLSDELSEIPRSCDGNILFSFLRPFVFIDCPLKNRLSIY